jgi:hypothetical protein
MREAVMTDREKRFVALKQELQTKAREAAEARKSIIGLYVAFHYPGVPYKITIMEDNLLSIDIVFPGLGRDLSHIVVNEVRGYLQELLQC